MAEVLHDPPHAGQHGLRGSLGGVRVLLLLVLAGCESAPAQVLPADAYVVLDAPAHPGAGPGGGLLPELSFAVVGDSRPANLDDTASYPTAIVQQIFTAVEAEMPHPEFVATTGDYMFASDNTGMVDAQLDLYLGARAAYSGIAYPAMGNHECTSLTQSNCGPGSSDGFPANYTQFVSRMVMPLGEAKPYYVERFAAMDGSWSAKLVFIAANAWTDAQARWLDLVLGEPTTYTFAVRHEPHYADSAPGVDPSTTILAAHPLTMLITGHVHSYAHIPASREIIVGNGGAPLSSGTDYGYVVIDRQPGGSLQVTSYTYSTHAIVEQFMVTPDGVVVAP
jgi:hypothetical protein